MTTNRYLKLELAAQLLREVVETLDQRDGICSHCGVRRYENWPERQAAIELTSAANKTERIARSLTAPRARKTMERT